MPGTLMPKMECALCSVIITGGAQCGACKKYLDYDCASIPEEEWIKLEDEEKAAWKCPTCLIPSSGYHQISLQAVLDEIRELKMQLRILPTLTEAVSVIKEELEDLRNCCGHNVAIVNDMSNQLSALEKQVTDLERLKAVVYTLQSYVERIRFLTTKSGPVRARHYDKAMRKLITFIRV
ncbi:hypothetical protein O3G_MSEX012835 [Manduca sexta]|uniref:Uncharacterized protein n=1 Tax=Manduca sexta TaxID=7130 RepID=A0A922CXB1_MANSE|nr:hypothetical protein O3G_MSEX012835 [Manduca sexta]